MGRMKIKRRKGGAKRSRQGHSFPVDRRALERSVAEITRMLDEREFESIDEANAFMEKTLSSGEPLGPAPRTPLEKAQELMYDAWDSLGKRRVELARKALAISPDCADAYVLLAEETAKSPEEARTLYEQGVKAGERVLGPEAFKEDVGDFWGILQTRPYMRARAGLAQCLWKLGERKQALDHFDDMLRLNPNDNQGIRYLLAQGLLEEGEDKRLEKLMKAYPEDAAASWLYTRALWFFRREGESKKSNARLREAFKINPFVPAYLSGEKKIPKNLPEYIGWGDESEAFAYAAEAVHLWRETPEALEWLKKNIA
jgi:tetratricopeptide (TPR) repeat protein